MVKRKIVVLMCMALMLAALPAFDGAYAQQGQGKGKRGAPADDGLYPGCPLNLNLTQEQSAKIQDVRNAFFKDTAGLRSDIFKKEQDMDVLMLEKTIDAEKAKKIQDEISSLRAQFAQKRLQAQLDLVVHRAVLPGGCAVTGAASASAGTRGSRGRSRPARCSGCGCRRRR